MGWGGITPGWGGITPGCPPGNPIGGDCPSIIGRTPIERGGPLIGILMGPGNGGRIIGTPRCMKVVPQSHVSFKDEPGSFILPSAHAQVCCIAYMQIRSFVEAQRAKNLF